MKADCYDLRSRIGNIELLVKDDDGKRVEEVPYPDDPYCFVKGDELEFDPVRRCGCKMDTENAPDGFVRVTASDPRDLRDFVDMSRAQTFEGDVRHDVSTSIDHDITFLQPPREETLYFDIEVDDRGTFVDPEDATARVIAIAAVGGDGERFYYDGEDEDELLRQFLVDADDYVALVGWNSLGYDFPYLENRCANKGMTVDWRRWVRHDLMPLYDMLAIPTKTVSTKLEDTGQRELGEGKTGVKPGEGRLWQLWNEDPDTLREYNMKDSELVSRIDEKYGLVKLLHVISDLCNYPPGSTCYVTKHGQVRFAIGQVVDAKILEVARRKGIPQANKRTYSKPADFPGGYVLEPKPGMYENLVVPDYSGMYPNIIRAWNFGRETYVEERNCGRDESGNWIAVGGDWMGHRIIKGESGGFVSPTDGPRSVPAEAADELVAMRADAADIVDKGVKAVNNTLYGVFAADHQRYFGPHSENITLVGQKLTGTVERIASAGHKYIEDVVYGDTDSVMIDMRVPDDMDPVDVAYVIAEDVEAEMQDWARGRGALAEHLTLDVDDVYDRFYIGNKKKRYFGHRIFDGEPCDNIKIRGFESRQSSWPEPVRQFQEDLMHARLFKDDVGPIIDEAKANLFNGVWDLEMATSTKLGQPINEYGRPTPYTRAAKKIKDKFGSNAVNVGDKINYIKYGDDKTDVAWVYDGEVEVDFRPNDGYCDECEEVVVRDEHEHETRSSPLLRDEHYSYLWQKKFKSVMHSIDVEEFQQTGLGAFQ